jgi:hypothetical protein
MWRGHLCSRRDAKAQREAEPVPSLSAFSASLREISCQGTCKPGSVHPLRGSATIPLGRKLPSASSDQPGRRAETGPCAAPIRSCTRWGLPCRARCRPRGALLPHPFALTRPKAGGMLSVALSLTPPKTKPPGVTRHRCSVEPGLSSPRLRGPRPPGPLAGLHIGGTAGFFESWANFTNFMGKGAIFVNLAMGA